MVEEQDQLVMATTLWVTNAGYRRLKPLPKRSLPKSTAAPLPKGQAGRGRFQPCASEIHRPHSCDNVKQVLYVITCGITARDKKLVDGRRS